jgi:hypothetical protein
MVLLPGCVCCGGCPEQPSISLTSSGYYVSPSKTISLSVVKGGEYFGYASHAFRGVMSSYYFPQTPSGMYIGQYDSLSVSNGRLRWVADAYAGCSAFNPYWSHDVSLAWQNTSTGYGRSMVLRFPWAVVSVYHQCAGTPQVFNKSFTIITDYVTVDELRYQTPIAAGASLSVSSPGNSGDLSATYTPATGSSQVSEFGAFSGYNQTFSVFPSISVFPLRVYGKIPVAANKGCLGEGGISGREGWPEYIEVDFTINSVTGGDGFFYGENNLP